MIQRYDIIRCAKMVHGDIAVAVAENEVPRVTAAQAADELLGAEGIQASIVLYRQGDGVSMSGRSQGDINVQLLLEPLGGGGNAAAEGKKRALKLLKEYLSYKTEAKCLSLSEYIALI